MTDSDDLTRALRRGSLSRRQLLGGATALGVAAAGVPLLGAGPAQAADQPRKGGTLRIGMAGGSTTDSLDPTTWTDSVGLVIGFALWNGLIENGPDNKPVAELAESWEAKPGAIDWVFNLRKGVKFSNGKEFDADDAIYSLNLHRGPTTKSGAAGAMKEIADIKKLDTHQIQITLVSGDADLPYVLSDYHLSMVPNGFTDWAHPIGSGGYTLDKFDPGVRCSLNRNKSYWKPGRANADVVEITVINDGSARLNALLSGQVDIIHRVDPKTIKLLKANHKVQVVQAPGGWHAITPMMIDRTPYDSNDLRMALKYVVDREAVLKTLFAGAGTLGNDHPIPKGDPYFNSSLPQTHQDIDKAKFYFKKAGSPTGIVLQASDAAFNGAVDMAILYQANAKKAGITLDVKKEPADGFWDNVWLKGSFTTSYWGGRPAATQMFGVAYKSDAPWNDTHWKIPAFDKLLLDARAELNESKRKAYLWEMQAMLHNQGGALIPVFRDWIDAHSSNVGGHTPHSGFDLDNGHICEKAWLKA